MRTRELSTALLLTACALSQSSLAQSVVVDFSAKPKPTSTVPLFSIGSDRTAIFLRESHQRDLKAFQKAIPFKYLRCHGIFNEEMNVVERLPDGSLKYNWTKVDAFIDRLREVGLRPFIEFGYMPEPLARGKHTVFYYKGNSTPPKSQTEWSDLVDKFVRRQISRFGIKEVRQWYFEVWNEPNLDYFWRGTMDEYFQLYETSARTLRKIDAGLRVGGPATAGLGWIKEFLAFCKAKSVPVDFVSTHTYGVTQGFVDAEGRGQTVLDTSPDAIQGGLAWVRSEINASPFPKLPFFVTEWGPSYSQVDAVHDNYICAAYILEKVTKSVPHTDGMSYWTFSDQFEEGGIPPKPFTGGFGLLNYDGLRKAGFYAYEFFGKLQKHTYPVADERVLASKDGSKVSIVAWDYSPPVMKEPNNPYFHRDNKPTPLPDKVLTLRGLAPGKYRVHRTGVGYMRNDVYGSYMALGSPVGKDAHLPPDVLKKLHAQSSGKPERLAAITIGANGIAEVRLPMRTNDAWLVEMVREESRWFDSL